MIFIRIKFSDMPQDYAVIINTEENKSGSDSIPRYQHTKSTWVQPTNTKQFDARLKDKLRKVRIMLIDVKELDSFLNTKQELPLGTLIDKNYGIYSCEHSLLALAALCDVTNFAKQFDANLNLVFNLENKFGVKPVESNIRLRGRELLRFFSNIFFNREKHLKISIDLLFWMCWFRNFLVS